MSDTWKSKITERARQRMAKPAWMQRKEALEQHARSKQQLPDPEDVPDADDASLRRRNFL